MSSSQKAVCHNFCKFFPLFIHRFCCKTCYFPKTLILQDVLIYERFDIQRSCFAYANANPNGTYHLRIHLFPSMSVHQMQKSYEKPIGTFLDAYRYRFSALRSATNIKNINVVYKSKTRKELPCTLFILFIFRAKSFLQCLFFNTYAVLICNYTYDNGYKCT
jgi:hypothetical protein